MSETTAQFAQMVREASKSKTPPILGMWEAWEIEDIENPNGYKEPGDLFLYLVTADKGRTLIAQVVNREEAESIVREHNKGMP